VALIINIQDFQSADFKLPVNSLTNNDLQAVIDRVEMEVLGDLLGEELTILFLNDLQSGVPQSSIYLDLFNKFRIKATICEPIYVSKGIKNMLKNSVVFEYLKLIETQHTMVGTASGQSETSSKYSALNSSKVIESYFNATRTFNAITKFICENIHNYPLYEGVGFRDNISII
jgi:hypothetical protein